MSYVKAETITLRILGNSEVCTTFRVGHDGVIQGTWLRTDATLAPDAAWWTAEERDAEKCGTTLDALLLVLEGSHGDA